MDETKERVMDDSTDRVLAEVDREWRRCGVDRRHRVALAADLRTDLQQAVADGRSPAELLGPDVPAFARRLADCSTFTKIIWSIATSSLQT